MNILLDYFFPITQIAPTPAASTAFLKQACLVVEPADSVPTGVVTECISMAQVSALTDNVEAQALFDAGMTKVFILPMATLDMDTVLEAQGSRFFTLLISSDFTDANVTTDLTVGSWAGVVGVSSASDAFLDAQAVIKHRCAFFRDNVNGAKNMLYAFGKLLSNQLNWLNQQFVPVPLGDGVNTLGLANSLFDRRISFVITDDQYANRIGFFVCGGQAIVAPYVVRNLEIELQSRALQYIADNNPQHTIVEASLIEDELQKVIDEYISVRQWIEAGEAEVGLVGSNFVAGAQINISEPSALWRIFGELRQSL